MQYDREERRTSAEEKQLQNRSYDEDVSSFFCRLFGITFLFRGRRYSTLKTEEKLNTSIVSCAGGVTTISHDS